MNIKEAKNRIEKDFPEMKAIIGSEYKNLFTFSMVPKSNTKENFANSLTYIVHKKTGKTEVKSIYVMMNKIGAETPILIEEF